MKLERTFPVSTSYRRRTNDDKLMNSFPLFMNIHASAFADVSPRVTCSVLEAICNLGESTLLTCLVTVDGCVGWQYGERHLLNMQFFA